MKNRNTTPSRRDFLRWTAGGAAAATAFQTLGSSSLLHAAAPSANGTYKALVVLYLAGGNDSYNMVVPTNTPAYNDYQDSRQGLSVPSGELLSIAPATSDGNTYGLHPSLAPLRPLFDDGKLAIVANAGNLVNPVTKAQYAAKSVALPPRLFSHNDQQAQSMKVAADDGAAIGWGGALADAMIASNGGAALSPGISIAGSTPWLSAANTQAYHLGTNGSVALNGFSGNTGASLKTAFDTLRGQAKSNLLQQQIANTRAEAVALDALISNALDQATPLVTEFPEDSKSSDQLEMVARMVSVQGALGMERQVFFVKIGGFDTHAGQLNDQPNLYADLAASVAAFQQAMEDLNCENNVTLAVVSEFGRTLSSNGQGTDHGWGGHFLVSGGAVAGGDIYGAMPSFVLDGADDSGNGRMIPTTATDQFAATLARWFGVPPANLGTIFPNLSNFATSDLGFMS